MIMQDFKKVKESSELFYGSIGEVWCPYLKEKVIFNAKGKEHLKFKSKNKARSLSDQYVRFKILKYAPEVIKNSHTIQGFSNTKSFEVMRSNHLNERFLIDVTYFEFIAVLEEKVRVRIIIKKIESSQPYFWSIIPFWKKRDGERKNINYGNLEEA